jgi:hypothetical protein
MARVPVISPEGQTGTVEEAELPQALAAGFKSGEQPSIAGQAIKQGLTAGLAAKGGAAIDATAASINQWARQNLPALAPSDPTVTETRTGGAGVDLSWTDRYENAKRVNQAMEDAARAQDPLKYGVIQAVAGMAPATKVLQGAKGATLALRSGLFSAAEGAGESRGQTIGDVVGDASVRGALGALVALPLAALDKVPALKDWLRKRAGIEAFKQAAAGNAKSLAGQVGGPGRAQEIGQYMLDQGMLKGGALPEDIARAAAANRGAAGQAIGEAVRGSGATVNLPSLISRLETDVLADAKAGGSLYSGVVSKVGGHIDDLRALQASMGDEVPAGIVHNMKVKLGDVINWQSDKPLAEALQRTSGIESDAIKRGVTAAGQGAQLVSANKGFGLAADLQKVAEKGAEGQANRVLGLSEQGGGIGGAVIGTLAGGPLGGAATGLIGGAASHYWRLHGSGLSARALNVGANSLDAVSAKLAANPQMASYANFLRQTMASAGPAAAASAHFLLYDKDPAYRQAVTGEGP